MSRAELNYSDEDINFIVYYDIDDDIEVDITGLYLSGSQVDLVNVIDDYVFDDLAHQIQELCEVGEVGEEDEDD